MIKSNKLTKIINNIFNACSDLILSVNIIFILLACLLPAISANSNLKSSAINASGEDKFLVQNAKHQYPISGSIKLFILAGQSNMVGSASNLNELSPRQLEPQNHVLWYDKNNQWVTLQPPTEPLPSTRRVFNGVGFGPEISLGLILAKNLDETVALVKYAVNGTNLEQQWNPRNSDSYYHKMIERVEKSTIALSQLGYNVEIAGFFWMQGESDAKNDRYMAGNYQLNLTYLIHQVRQDLSHPRLPFVYGAIAFGNNHETKPFGTFEYGDVVRHAQFQVNNTVPITRLVETLYLAKYTDNLHFNSHGLFTLGHNLADAWLEIICFSDCTRPHIPDSLMLDPLPPWETVMPPGRQCLDVSVI